MGLINTKLFSPRNVIFIAIVTVAVHFLAKPLYSALDGDTAASPDA